MSDLLLQELPKYTGRLQLILISTSNEQHYKLVKIDKVVTLFTTGADCLLSVAPSHFLQSCRACCLAPRCQLSHKPIVEVGVEVLLRRLTYKPATFCKTAGPARLQKVERRHTRPAISSSGNAVCLHPTKPTDCPGETRLVLHVPSST